MTKISILDNTIPMTNRGVKKPTKQEITSQYSDEYSCKTTFYTDWIEFTAYKTPQSNFTKNINGFEVEIQDRGTSLFKCFYYLFYKKVKIATIESEPRVRFIDPSLIKIKLENHVNYSSDCYKVVKAIVEAYNLVFLHYTRIDFAFDFQDLNLKDMEIIVNENKEVSDRTKRKINKIRKIDSVKMFLESVAKNEIRMKGKQMTLVRNGNNINSVSFGCRTSEVRAVIYNKTREMRNKKWKQYIFETWQAAGFDKKKDVYRIEFQVKDGKTLGVNADGELIKTFKQIDFLQDIKQYGKYLLENNLFYTVDCDGRLRESVGIKLFNTGLLTGFKRVYSMFVAGATNIQKAVLKKITQAAIELKSSGRDILASMSIDLLRYMIPRAGLWEWWRNKYKDIDIRETKENLFELYTIQNLKNTKTYSFVQESIF